MTTIVLVIPVTGLREGMIRVMLYTTDAQPASTTHYLETIQQAIQINFN